MWFYKHYPFVIFAVFVLFFCIFVFFAISFVVNVFTFKTFKTFKTFWTLKKTLYVDGFLHFSVLNCSWHCREAGVPFSQKIVAPASRHIWTCGTKICSNKKHLLVLGLWAVTCGVWSMLKSYICCGCMWVAYPYQADSLQGWLSVDWDTLAAKVLGTGSGW